jgi:hypothetical protein
VNVAIQHHPRRAERIPWLVEQLAAECVVCTDPEPNKPTTNSWATYRLCLDQAPDDGHLLVVQDDIEPCPGMVAACEPIIEQHPDSVICLWHGSQPTRSAIILRAARHAGYRYARIKPQPWTPLVAAIWPTPLARRLGAWYDQQAATPLMRKLRADDAVVARFLHQERAQIFATIPSTCEHPDTDSIRKRVRGRYALEICDGDALDVDWTGPVYSESGSFRSRRAVSQR